MFETELEALRSDLETNNPLLEKVFIHYRVSDNPSGITDKFRNYIVLELVEDEDGETYIFERQTGIGKEAYSVTTTAKLIAGFECIDKSKAITKLIEQLAAKHYTITAISTNEELIYQSETGEPWQKNDSQLIRFRFNMSKITNPTGSCDGICEEDCCKPD